MKQALDKAHCELCITQDTCLVCRGEHYMTAGHCCAFNQYWDHKRCSNCHHHCSSCTGKGKKACTGCAADRIPFVRQNGKAFCREDFTKRWNRANCMDGYTFSAPSGDTCPLNCHGNKYCAPLAKKHQGMPAQPCDAKFRACPKNFGTVAADAGAFLVRPQDKLEIGWSYGRHSACFQSTQTKCASKLSADATDAYS